MVRRKVIPALVLLFCLLLAMPAQANAASVYDGSISTTYITIFRDIASKIPITDDYVFFRSGQYDYMMVVGQFDDTGTTISTTGQVTVYTISTNSGSYNNAYEYSVSTESGFSLSPGSALIYSNLRNYPDLIERNDYFEFTALSLMFVGLLCYLLRSFFGFSLRNRG